MFITLTATLRVLVGLGQAMSDFTFASQFDAVAKVENVVAKDNVMRICKQIKKYFQFGLVSILDVLKL